VTGWIVLAIVVLALVGLGAACAPLLGSLRELGHVGRALQRRAGEAQALQPAAEALQERIVELQERAAAVGERAATLRGPRS
jgi:hypothetical protein